MDYWQLLSVVLGVALVGAWVRGDVYRGRWQAGRRFARTLAARCAGQSEALAARAVPVACRRCELAAMNVAGTRPKVGGNC